MTSTLEFWVWSSALRLEIPLRWCIKTWRLEITQCIRMACFSTKHENYTSTTDSRFGCKWCAFWHKHERELKCWTEVLRTRLKFSDIKKEMLEWSQCAFQQEFSPRLPPKKWWHVRSILGTWAQHCKGKGVRRGYFLSAGKEIRKSRICLKTFHHHCSWENSKTNISAFKFFQTPYRACISILRA